LLLSRTKQDRLSKIERIKIEDGQKINELNDQIERLKFKAKSDRLNKIKTLKDSAAMAKALGITNSNFKAINNNNNNNNNNNSGSGNPSLTVTIEDNQQVPKWYLFGETALLEEINILKNRDDEAYIPEIVNLQNKLSSIKSNQTLKTLESRKDDSPFVAEINKLDIEAIKLKSFEPSSAGINAMQLNQHAYPPETPIKPKKKLIVTVAFVAGFILSIFLVFIMNAFRKEEDKVVA
jgi:LPS O-antigen subunit length determinant protein (WzzB/FepE family)